MEVTGALVAAARRGRREAVIDLLTLHYRAVWRIATGLTGDLALGRPVVRYIMQRSLKAVDTWNDDGAPTRWFHHHTVLRTREVQPAETRDGKDTLLSSQAAADLLYVAFVRALRALPVQQREAFLLSHGEGLNIRAVAIAMDCSMIAAEIHLREASDRLQGLAGSEHPILVARMVEAYKRLEPDVRMTVTQLRRQVQWFMLPWTMLRWMRGLFALLLLGATIWAGFWVWWIVEESMKR